MMQCSYQAAVVAKNVRCLVFTCSASYTRQEDIRYNLAALIDTAIAIHLVGSSSNNYTLLILPLIEDNLLRWMAFDWI